MNDALCRADLDKGCTYYPIFSLLTQPVVESCVNDLRLRNSSHHRDLKYKSHHLIVVEKIRRGRLGCVPVVKNKSELKYYWHRSQALGAKFKSKYNSHCTELILSKQ